VDCIIVRWHVSTFRNELATLSNDALGFFTVYFVLGGAWHDDVDVTFENSPWAFSFKVLSSL
jgi:hypothetical protein